VAGLLEASRVTGGKDENVHAAAPALSTALMRSTIRS
jgi:hypothetical protein